jgi:hypothetical protein
MISQELTVRSAIICLCLSLWALPVFSQVKAAESPQALVTFYSTGSFWKSGIPGYKHGSFAGLIFDEYDELALIGPGHYITFKLDAGPHTFSANSWMIPTPTGGGHLKVDLVANQHYYIATFYSAATVVLTLPSLENRTCEAAQKETAKATPLAPKHLRKYGATRVVDETALPPCPPTPAPGEPIQPTQP